MLPKRALLFSASIVLFLSLTARAQDSSVGAIAQDSDGPPSIGYFTTGGNFLGITAQEVTRENMGRYNLREPRGLVITRISAESPATRAGLRVGDVILRFEGEQVTTYRKLQRLISEAAPEQTVRLSISRAGSEQEVSVTLSKRTSSFEALSRVYGAQAQQSAEAGRALEALRNQGTVGFGWGRRIGINTTQLTKQLADFFGITGGHGVLVTSVAENSPAARAGLKAGDVITDADGEKIESSGDLSRAINRKTDGAVNLKVVRDRNQMNISVTPEKREGGAISVMPEVLEIEPIEITMPTIEMPQIKPIKIKPIRLPSIKLKPGQLEQLRKLESLELEETL